MVRADLPELYTQNGARSHTMRFGPLNRDGRRGWHCVKTAADESLITRRTCMARVQALGVLGLALTFLCLASPGAAQSTGYAGAIYAGQCGDLAGLVAALGEVTGASGNRLGHADAVPAANASLTVPISLDDLVANDHAIVVEQTGDHRVIACGEVGGFPTDDGSLILGLRRVSEPAVAGVAYVAPGSDPAQTDISLFFVPPAGVTTAGDRPTDEQTTLTLDESDPLGARLGGTVASFEAAYGVPLPPEVGNPSPSTEYGIAGYSTVYAESREGVISEVSLFAPRADGEEWSDDAPHPLDWSIAKAHDLVRDFLPEDVAIGTPRDVFASVIVTECSSPSLASRVPESVYADADDSYFVGQCSYVLFLNPDESAVSWIVIDLHVEPPPDLT